MPKKPTVRVQMADEAADLPSPDEILKAREQQGIDALAALAVDQEPRQFDDNPNATGTPPHLSKNDPAFIPPPPMTEEITTNDMPAHNAGFTTYQSRIKIVEAWRYPGSFKDAPSFIDRNWAAYGDYDDERKIEAGPALRLPARTATGEKLARKGDYVVRQQVILAPGLEPDEEVDVWPAEQFERLFVPTSRPFRPFSPPQSAASTSPQDAPAAVPDAALPVGPLLPAESGGNGDPRPSTKGGG